MQQRPLLDLLGARWLLGAPIMAAAWDAASGVAGFALADGTLALAPASWEGGPVVSERAGGGIELMPARLSPQPVTQLAVQFGGCRCIAAGIEEGFVTSGNAGTLAWTTSDGRSTSPPPLAAEVCGPITALVSAPEGHGLAFGHADGIMLITSDQGARQLLQGGAPQALAWGPGGRLAAWTERDALQFWSAPDAVATDLPGCPAPPGAIAFIDGGRLLVAGGGPQPLCWRVSQGPEGPSACGLSGRHRVISVAGHPSRSLLATGHVNGAVLLSVPSGRDVLFLRSADGDAVTALAWSGDGERLAIGTASGEIAVLALPAAMFRAEKSP